MLQVCLQMFFSEGLNRPLGLHSRAKEQCWWQECCSGFLSIQSSSHSKAWPLADVQDPPHSHFVFSHPRKFTNLTKNTKSHLKGKCSVLQLDTTEFRLFAKWQNPKEEETSNLWTGCLEACTWACWWERQSILILEFSHLPIIQLKTEIFISVLPNQSQKLPGQKKMMHFTPRTATLTTWFHLKYRNIL